MIGLYSHLYGVHKQMMNNQIKNSVEMMATASSNTQNVPNATEPPKKRKITDCYRSTDTMETIVTRMIALDGISVRVLTESQDLRDLFQCSGFNLPDSTKSITKMIFKKVDDVKEDIKKSIANMKKAGHKFALALEEWTSAQHDSYMNITLHSKALSSCFTLGPITITDTTISTLTSINDYLNTFNVSIQDDIVSLTTDDSTDMKKIGIHFPGYHQWCLAIGVQAAIINTMYRAPLQSSVTEAQMVIDDSTDTESTDTESDNNSIAYEEFEVCDNCRKKVELHFHKEVIDKLREVIKMINKSHLNTTTLQDYVKKDLNEDSQLLLDNQITWTSVIDMIGSFLKEKDCVLTLLHGQGTEIAFTEEELMTLSEIHINLDLARHVVRSLCREDSTLFTADTALRSLLMQLEEQNSDLSQKLAEALRKQIKDRRLPIAGVLHYLHDFKSFTAFLDDDTTFLMPNNEQITDLIVGLLYQLKFEYIATDSNINLLTTGNESTNTLLKDQDKELTLTIDRKDQAIDKTKYDLKDLVSSERHIYESKGEKGNCLTKAYEYLLTVMPTNVHPDKIFGVCGCVSNKIVSFHPDKVMKDLIFLRTYYAEQRRMYI